MTPGRLAMVCYCYQLHVAQEAMLGALSNGCNIMPDRCSHGQHDGKGPFSSPLPVWIWQTLYERSGWVTDPVLCASTPECSKHLHMVTPFARIFTKAKERHFFPSGLSVALMFQNVFHDVSECVSRGK